MQEESRRNHAAIPFPAHKKKRRKRKRGKYKKKMPTEAAKPPQQDIIHAAAKEVAENLTPKKETMPLKQMPLHIPHSGPSGPREVTRVPILEERPQKIVRPPAKYTNLPTPYGIASQMLQEQMEEELKKKTG